LNANENKNLSTTQINLGKERGSCSITFFMMKTKNLSGRIEWLVLKKKRKIVPIDGFELRELFQMKQKLKW
jgi:hypothetical protein